MKRFFCLLLLMLFVLTAYGAAKEYCLANKDTTLDYICQTGTCEVCQGLRMPDAYVFAVARTFNEHITQSKLKVLAHLAYAQVTESTDSLAYELCTCLPEQFTSDPIEADCFLAALIITEQRKMTLKTTQMQQKKSGGGYRILSTASDVTQATLPNQFCLVNIPTHKLLYNFDSLLVGLHTSREDCLVAMIHPLWEKQKPDKNTGCYLM